METNEETNRRLKATDKLITKAKDEIKRSIEVSDFEVKRIILNAVQDYNEIWNTSVSQKARDKNEK